jgi:hypothetical protein
MHDAGGRDVRAEVWEAVEVLLAEPADAVDSGRRSVAGWLPAAALSGLVAVDHAHGYVLAVLAPEIGTALGVGASVLAVVLFLRVVGYLLGVKATAGRGRVPGGAGSLAIGGALVWGMAALAAGATQWLWLLAVATLVYGAACASVPVAHPRLLRRFYGERSPAMEVHRNAGRIGNALCAAVPGLVVALGFGWQAAFVVAGTVSLPLALVLAAALRQCRGNSLRTTQRIASASAEDRVGEALGRLAAVPVVRRLLLVVSGVAVLEIPLYAYLFTLLDQRWHIGPAGRGVLGAALEGVSVVISLVMVRRRQGLARIEPDRLLLGLAGALAIGAIALVGVAVVPSQAVGLTCIVITALVLSPITPLLWMGPLAIVGVPRTDRRRAALELAGVVGAGVMGLALAAVAERAGGPAGALLFLSPLLLVPAALSAWTAVQLGSTVSSERRSSTGSGASARASDSSRIASA